MVESRCRCCRKLFRKRSRAGFCSTKCRQMVRDYDDCVCGNAKRRRANRCIECRNAFKSTILPLVARLYRSGLSAIRVGEAVNCSEATVLTILRMAKEPIRAAGGSKPRSTSQRCRFENYSSKNDFT